MPAALVRRVGPPVLALVVLMCFASAARADGAAPGPLIVVFLGGAAAVSAGVLYVASSALALVTLWIVAPRWAAFREARLTAPAFLTQLITLPVAGVGLLVGLAILTGEFTSAPLAGRVAAAGGIVLGAAILTTLIAGAIYAARARARFLDGLLLALIPTAVRLMLLAGFVLASWAARQ
jgi:hypothetical protein